MRVRLQLFRIFAAALVLGAVLHVGTLLPRVGRLAETLPAGAWLFFTSYALSTMTALGACGLAVLLLWKASHKPDGRALTLFLGFLAIFWGSLFRFMTIEAEGTQINVSLSYGSGWVSQTAMAAFVLAVASFVRFSALFPRPLTPERLRPVRRLFWLRRLRAATLSAWTVWGVAAGIILLPHLVSAAFARVFGLGEDAARAADRAADGFHVAATGMGRTYLLTVAAAYVMLPVVASVVGARNLRLSYRLAVPGERERMLWVTTGFTLAAWLIVSAFGGAIVVGALDLVPELIAMGLVVLLVLAPLLVVLGSAMGVLYAGAIDPALALRRSTLYGALGTLGIVAFAGIENVLSELVEERLGLPTFIGPLVAGGIVAAVLVPVQRRLSGAFARRRAETAASGHGDVSSRMAATTRSGSARSVE
ncbi:MAG: hypothetical protein ACREM1_08770 [Longimicrobiales bacterium]